MEMSAATTAFAALSQPTRLRALKQLLQAGTAGVNSGDLGARLGIRPNTMSANLSVLAAAGLVRASREGRAVRYFADLDGVRGLLSYLMQDCCGGTPGLCTPILNDLVGAA